MPDRRGVAVRNGPLPGYDPGRGECWECFLMREALAGDDSPDECLL